MINTAQELDNIRNNLAGSYKLGANIDLSSISSWVPIGDAYNPFTGILDGAGFKITGLTIVGTSLPDRNKTASITNSNNNDFVGLFGYTLDAEIKNLGIGINQISARTSVGGLAGRIRGTTVSNVFIYGGKIVADGINGTQTPISNTTSVYVGGLVGEVGVNPSGSKIENSYVVDTEIVGVNFVGGLIGRLGLPTSNPNQILNSYAAAKITASGTSSIGGFIGGTFENGGTAGITFANNFWDTSASGRTNNTIHDIALGRTTEQMKLESNFTNWVFTNIWAIEGPESSSLFISYPYLQSNTQNPKPGLQNVERVDEITDVKVNNKTALTGSDAIDTFAGIVEVDVTYNIRNQVGNIMSAETATLTINNNSGGKITISGNKVTFLSNTANGTYTITIKSDSRTTTTATVQVEVRNFADKTALQAKVDEVNSENLDEINYTSASWTTFSGTLTSSQVVLDNANATQEQVDNSLATLTGSRGDLAPIFPVGNGDDIPYQITTAEQLNAIRYFLDKNFILMNDLDLTDDLAPNGQFYNAGKGWQPIGDSTNPFKGVFDGKDFEIKNLSIVRADEDYVGLFGTTFTGAVLKNLQVSGEIIGKVYTGALVGVNGGTVDNVHSKTSVKGSSNLGGLVGLNQGGTITKSSATGNVTSTAAESTDPAVRQTAEYIGGLVGLNSSGSISQSFASGNVYGGQIVGGLVGANDQLNATIADCYAFGAVEGTSDLDVGGFVGYNNGGAIIRSYSAGQVTGPVSDTGGFIGANTSGTITNSFWDVETSGLGNHGDDNLGATGKTTAEMKTLATFTGATWDFTAIWTMAQGSRQSYPYFGALAQDPIPGVVVSLIGDGTDAIPYQITDWYQLDEVRNRLDKSFKLMNNLDDNSPGYQVLASVTSNDGKGWQPIGDDTLNSSDLPIGRFKGTFDGGGFTISGLVINRPEERRVGLFGYIDEATIENLGLISPEVTAKEQVGSLIGQGDVSTVTNCYASDVQVISTNFGNDGEEVGGLVGYFRGSHILKSYATGIAKGPERVGGLVGAMGSLEGTRSSIKESYADVTVAYEAESFSSGHQRFGGLVGNLFGSDIFDSFALGNVSGSAAGGLIGRVGDNNGTVISRSYSVGQVTGEGVGGFIGDISNDGDLTISDSYWDITTSGTTSSAGFITINTTNQEAIGKTTAEMQELTTFGGLDADNRIWDVVAEDDLTSDYPSLRWTTSSTSSAVWLMPKKVAVTQANAVYENFLQEGGVVGQQACASCNLTLTNGELNFTVGDPTELTGGSTSIDIADYPGYRVGEVIDGGVELGALIITGDELEVAQDVTWEGFDIILRSQGDIRILAEMTATGAEDKVILEYGQGAVAAENEAKYDFGLTAEGFAGKLNLQAGANFSTKLGSDGTAMEWTVITALGSEGDEDEEDALNSLQGLAYSSKLVGNYVLGADIDASATNTWNSGEGFEPIGDFELNPSFSGNFDGLGHLITNLIINRESNDIQGLFGKVVGSENLIVKISNTGLTGVNVKGRNSVGSLIGSSDYTHISDAFASGTVVGGDAVGGLLGYLSPGAISGSFADVAVDATGGAGGLAGSVYDVIVSDSYALGAVDGDDNTGGLVGNTGESSYLNTYATGTVSGSQYVGGLLGYAYEDVITDSYATGDVSGDENVGGLIGEAYSWSASVEIIKSHALGNVTGTADLDFEGKIGGLVGTIWADEKDIIIDDSFAEGTVSGLKKIGGLVGEALSGSSNDVTTSLKLTKGKATGAISGYREVGGLIGYMEDAVIEESHTTGVVSDIQFEGPGMHIGGLVGDAKGGSISDSYTTGDVSAPNSNYVGGLIGRTSKTDLLKVRADGEIQGINGVGGLVGQSLGGSINLSSASGEVTGSFLVGGLIGDAESYDGEISVNLSFAVGDVVGGGFVGGFIGYTYSDYLLTVSNSFAVGNATADNDNVGGFIGHLEKGDGNTSISNVYSTGTVIGPEGLAGGLVGDIWENAVEMENSYWDIETSGLTTSAGGEGKTTAEMQDIRTFRGMDPDSPEWVAEVSTLENINYPTLFWTTLGEGEEADDNDPIWLMPKVSLSQAVYLPYDNFLQEGGSITQQACASCELKLEAGELTFTVGNAADLAQFVEPDNSASSEGFNLGEFEDLGAVFAGLIITGDSLVVAQDVTWEGFDVILRSQGDIRILADMTATGAEDKVTLEYGQDAVAADNESQYDFGLTAEGFAGKLNLQAGQNFSTKLGSDGDAVAWTVITDLGAAGDESSASASNSLQGLAHESKVEGNYVLGADIDASATSTWNSGEGFEPIGYDAWDNPEPFLGRFDGLGHKITALTIDRPTTDGVALFGYAEDALFQNLNLDQANMSGEGEVATLAGRAKDTAVREVIASGTVVSDDDDYIGGLIGYLEDNSELDHAYADVEVSGGDDEVGGLIGQMDGPVKRATAYGNVSGFDHVGGLIGYLGSNSSVAFSSASGDVEGERYVGGLIGDISIGDEKTTVAESHASGTVKSNRNTTSSVYVGGLIGRAEASDESSSAHIEITNSHYKGESVEAIGDYVGGLIGYVRDVQIDSASATGAISGDGYLGGLIGSVEPNKDAKSVITRVHATGNVTGTGDYIGGLIGESENVALYLAFATGNVVGEEEIGGLIGDMYKTTIDSVYATGNVSGEDEIGGLVGYAGGVLGTSGEREVLISRAYATGNVTGTDGEIGGLVGNLRRGGIVDSYALGNVEGAADHVGGLVGEARDVFVRNSYASGTVKSTYDDSDAYVGGLIGRAEVSRDGLEPLEITNSHYKGESVEAIGGRVGGLIGYAGYDRFYSNPPSILYVRIDSASATGNVSGGRSYVGGLIGDVRGVDNGPKSQITRVHAMGNVTGGDDEVGGLIGYARVVELSDAFATGDVEGADDDIGGLIGGMYNTKIDSVYATGDVIGLDGVGGLVGGAGAATAGDILISRAYATGNVIGTEDEVGGLVGSLYQGGIDQSYALGNVSGEYRVGGLVGYADEDSHIQNSMAFGDVEGTVTTSTRGVGGLVGELEASSVVNSYSVGLVTRQSGQDIGGLIGRIDSNSSVTDSYWDTETSGLTESAEGEGKTTAEMQALATFLGGDEPWSIVRADADGLESPYPTLRWTTEVEADGIWLIAKNLGETTVEAILDQTYTGSGIEPELVIKDGNDILVAGVDYELSFEDNINVGTAKVTISSVEGGKFLGTTSASFEITGKQLTVASQELELSKPYDGTISASIDSIELDGVVAGEEVTVTAVASYDNANSGTGRTITVVYTIAGEDADNYLAPEDLVVTNGVITKAQLTLASQELTTEKVFDSSTTAAVSDIVLSGVVGDEEVEATGVATYDNANVGTDKAITVVYTIAGEDAGNYLAPEDVVVETAVITAKTLPAQELVIEDQVFTGAEITVTLTVKDGDVILEEGVDYEVTYTDNTDAGTATVTVTGIGNYAGTLTSTFEIESKSLEDAEIGEIATQSYTGSPLTPSVTVKDGTVSLEEGKDFTVSYTDNINVGTATVTVTGIGNYAGTLTSTFEIESKSLEDAEIGEIAAQTYTGSPLTPTITVKDVEVILEEGVDYEVTLTDNTDAGTATVTVTGIGNYAGTLTSTFEIESKSLEDAEIGEITAQSYTGSPLTPAVSVKDGEVILEEGVDYEVTFTDNTDAGTATVTVTGIGNYASTITSTFEIESKSLEDAEIGEIAAQSYTGSALTPTVMVKDGTVTLEEDKDFTVTYSNNMNAGTATVTVTGIGNYAGSITSSFTIDKHQVTVIAADAERNFGEENPVFTFSYEGLLNDDKRVAVEPAISTPATSSSLPGTYPIVLTGGSDPNYELTLVNGVLTVIDPYISPVQNLVGQVDDKEVSLSWEAPAESATDILGYRIEVSEDGENYTLLTETEALEYLAADLTNSQKYWFRISAFTAFSVGEEKVIGPLIPIAPVTDDNSTIPTQDPGTYTFTLDGNEEDVFLDIVDDALVFEAGSLKMDLAAARATGDQLPILEGLLVLEPNGIAKVNGEGFKQNTAVAVWLIENVEGNAGGRIRVEDTYLQTRMLEVNASWQQTARVMGSQPGKVYFLGYADIDQLGKFSASMNIPADIKPGRYTLQATGITTAGSEMSLNLGAILMLDLDLDTDGDGVPDVYEYMQGTDPNNVHEYRDSNGDGVPDYVRERSPIEYYVPGAVQSAWGQVLAANDLPKEVVLMNGFGQLVFLEVNWNLSTVNVFSRGNYEVIGELVIPQGMFNAYDIKATIEVLILPKAKPEDILLSNSTFDGARTSQEVAIGTLSVVDPIDNIHVLGVPYDLEDNRYFRVINNVLYWSSEDPAAGRTTFKVVVRVTDRDFNTLDKVFEITRNRERVSEIEIYNTFTPDGDGINDNWGVPEIRYYTGARVQVFERSGKRLFYTEDPDQRWDGTFESKEMPVGSYYWTLEVRETGEVRKGILNLLRK
ncbi:hypothetical protein GCM10026987_02010 [Belliella aquatica]|uniref:Fibronectin type-III domain-containing protein n=1 Tax=Belliella aquatica TaxID=1323734 RepID=A0ABQ1N6L3_9BACT|nr:hypothetical protein GCM10010993_36630 [Belliella aquatica]